MARNYSQFERDHNNWGVYDTLSLRTWRAQLEKTVVLLRKEANRMPTAPERARPRIAAYELRDIQRRIDDVIASRGGA